jgi:hypothetical protein
MLFLLTGKADADSGKFWTLFTLAGVGRAKID